MSLLDFYNYVVYESMDQRVKDWPLMSSPLTILLILVSYLLIVLKIGPEYMRNRRAYKLKRVIAVYNISQMFSNLILFYYCLNSGWLTTYKFGCQPTDYSNSIEAIRMAKVIWWIFISKLVDLIDTLICILRKKNNQITFLHVYHHVSTVLFVWTAAKYTPGGLSSLPMLLNCFVHIFMYAYYLSTLADKKYRKQIQGWKKTVTAMQMIQFIVIFILSLPALQPSCPINKFIATFHIMNLVFVFYLFSEFYTQNYTHSE